MADDPETPLWRALVDDYDSGPNDSAAYLEYLNNFHFTDEEDMYATNFVVHVFVRTPSHNRIEWEDEFSGKTFACYDPELVRQGVCFGLSLWLDTRDWQEQDMPKERHDGHKRRMGD